jgi:hypothetical protein
METERYLGSQRSSCGTLIRKSLADTQLNARMDDGDVGDGCVRCEPVVAVVAVCDVCSLLHLHLGLSALLRLVTESISSYTGLSP